MLGTGATGGMFGFNDALVAAEPDVPDLEGFFLPHGDRQDRAAGTYLRALHAFMVAEGGPVVHFGLKHPRKSVFKECGLQYMRGTGAYAKVTGGALFGEIPQADGTGGRYGVIAHAFPTVLFGKCRGGGQKSGEAGGTGDGCLEELPPRH